jgi:hypothetical protein
VVMVIASLLAVLAFYLSGTPPLSLTSWRTDSSADGSTAFGEFQVHWPFVAVGIPGLIGALSIVWPQRRPPRLQ